MTRAPSVPSVDGDTPIDDEGREAVCAAGAPVEAIAAGLAGPVEQARAHASWRFLLLLEICNYAGLRRHLGRAGAASLTTQVARRAARVVRGAAIMGASRTLVELDLPGEAVCELEDAIADLRLAFDAPLTIDGETHRVELAIGASAGLRADCEELRLVEAAEGALEEARAEGRPVVRDLSTCAPVLDRLALSRELGAAIVNGEMFLQYQPKVHCRRREVASAEALVRWQHPTRGLILPGDFITMAEDMREIRSLTLWTLAQVIHDHEVLARDGHDLTLFINISGQLLSDPRFVAEACAMIAGGTARIGFEITETAVIRDPNSAIANLNRFAETGITIAIDDYGAGLSSLAYLKQLPARELKIDKLFVMQLTSSHRDPLIVRSTIDLAHALEMEVTAEGVETEGALALLTVMGCDMVQGYLLSRPITLDAFRRYLSEEKALSQEEDAATLRRPPSFWRRAGGAAE